MQQKLTLYLSWVAAMAAISEKTVTILMAVLQEAAWDHARSNKAPDFVEAAAPGLAGKFTRWDESASLIEQKAIAAEINRGIAVVYYTAVSLARWGVVKTAWVEQTSEENSGEFTWIRYRIGREIGLVALERQVAA